MRNSLPVNMLYVKLGMWSSIPPVSEAHWDHVTTTHMTCPLLHDCLARFKRSLS